MYQQNWVDQSHYNMVEDKPHFPAKESFDDKKTPVNLRVHQVYNGTTTPSESDNPDQEAQQDTLSHHILKGGHQVLVTWTIDEESVIVRKLDFLFLPIFSVGLSAVLISCVLVPR